MRPAALAVGDLARALYDALDSDDVARRFLRHMVPTTADWGIVEIRESQSSRVIGYDHADSDRVPRVEELVQRYSNTASLVAQALLRSNRNRRQPASVVATGESLAMASHDADHLELLRELRPMSMIATWSELPDGRVLAVLLVRDDTAPAFEESDCRGCDEAVRLLIVALGSALSAERLTRDARTRDRFLAVLGHELRVPLAPVSGALDVLAELDTPPNIRELTALIRRNVDVQRRLIDDMLDLGRIINGKVRLERSRVDVHRLVADAIGICRGELRAASLELATDLKAQRLIVDVDGARIQQVLWNLLRNAIKFTKPGGLITISSWDEGPSIAVSIRDTGVGIEADQLERIFNPFDQGRRPAGEGLGLGLAICRSVVELHDGSITAESSGAGDGATFTIRLPVLDPQSDGNP